MRVAPKLPTPIAAALVAMLFATAPVAAQTAVQEPSGQRRPIAINLPRPAPVTDRWITPANPTTAEAIPAPPRARRCRGLACPSYPMLGTAY